MLAALLWILLAPLRSPPTLAAGLKCVENVDQEGVDRIEGQLRRMGRVDEATVLRCAWLTRHGSYQEVLRRLSPQLLEGPLRRDVLRLAGECLFRVGDLPRAEVALKTLATEFPDVVESHRLLAIMYYDLGSNDLTLQELDQVQKLAPQDYRPHHMAGLILSDAEKYLDAAKQFRLSLDKDPPEPIRGEIRRELAKSLIRIREYQDAIGVLDPDAESPERSALLAECYWSLGQKDRSNRIVDDALNLSPDHRPSLRIKVRLLEDEGNIEDAVKVLRQILKAEPYDVESRYTLVQLLGVRGLNEQRDREQAEYARYRKLQDRLVELNLEASSHPDAVAPRRELAQVCQELGRTQLAEMWRRAADVCEQRLRQQNPN